MVIALKKYFTDLFVRPDKQIPVLDGVRTLAILLVVALHCTIQMRRAGMEPASFAGIPPFTGGWIGVPLFFILSGYFIGTQLWREFLKTKSVHVGKFILRRGMRIWPLFYFVILVSYLLYPENSKDLWTNLFFVANYFGDAGPIRGAWSLSTEEQFYIVIPTLIFICAQYFKFSSLKTYRRLLFGLLLLPIVSRAITWYMITGFEYFDVNLYIHNIYRPFHTHFDGLIVGLLISNIQQDKDFQTPKLLQKPFLMLALTGVVAIGLKLASKVLFTYFSLAICFGAFVWWMLKGKGPVHKLMSTPFFYWTAKVSYGVYVTHFIVLWAMQDLGWFASPIVNSEVHLLLTYAVAFFVSCAISSVTYVFIEAPFIDLRNKMLHGKPKATSNDQSHDTQKAS